MDTISYSIRKLVYAILHPCTLQRVSNLGGGRNTKPNQNSFKPYDKRYERKIDHSHVISFW